MKSSIRKTQANAKLKTLPDERQAEIIEYMRNHTYPQTVEWLQAAGLPVSTAALSFFWHWWQMRQLFQINQSVVEAVLEFLKQQHPELTPEKVRQAGQALFSALALQQQDVGIWAKAQQIELRRDQLAFNREKFQFDAVTAALQHAAELKNIASNSTLTDVEKLEWARRQLFGDAA